MWLVLVQTKALLAMPQFTLPYLSDDLDRLSACLMVDVDDRDLVQWVKQNEVREALATLDVAGKQLSLEVTLNTWHDDDDEPETDTVHLHVEISRLPLERPAEADYQTVFAKMSAFIEKMNGAEGFCATHACVPVPRSELPEQGTIARLLGFSRRSCGANFSLTSASLDIEDEAFDRLSFRYNEERETVYCQLWSSGFIEIDGDYLEHFAELVDIGVGCFLFERISREPSNV